MDQNTFIGQTLATVYNYIHTGRSNKALATLVVAQKVAPNSGAIEKLFQTVGALQFGHQPPDLTEEFGQFWRGEPLDGKSIEVFCDQGMGDTIQMLRYLRVMKEKWGCKIVVNCYAYFDALRELMAHFSFIDEFVNCHVQCDYVTNIMSLPSIFHELPDAPHYPARFAEIDFPVPEQPLLDFGIRNVSKPAVGLAWMSNPKNILNKDKSLPVELLHVLADPRWRLVDLVYSDIDFTIGLDFLEHPQIETVEDLAYVIAGMDMVVSVDTLTLHLSGTMKKPTIGLLHSKADPRWDHPIWYETVRTIVQKEEDIWDDVIKEARYSIESFLKIS